MTKGEKKEARREWTPTCRGRRGLWERQTRTSQGIPLCRGRFFDSRGDAALFVAGKGEERCSSASPAIAFLSFDGDTQCDCPSPVSFKFSLENGS